MKKITRRNFPELFDEDGDIKDNASDLLKTKFPMGYILKTKAEVMTVGIMNLNTGGCGCCGYAPEFKNAFIAAIEIPAEFYK